MSNDVAVEKISASVFFELNKSLERKKLYSCHRIEQFKRKGEGEKCKEKQIFGKSKCRMEKWRTKRKVGT